MNKYKKSKLSYKSKLIVADKWGNYSYFIRDKILMGYDQISKKNMLSTYSFNSLDGEALFYKI